MKKLRIAFAVNSAKAEVKRRARSLGELAARHGIEVAAAAAEADILVALGGDGTILKAVHEYPALPVLGLNYGGLGYLASVERDDFGRALDLLARGRYTVSQRTMLDAGGGAVALNDIVLRGASAHTAVVDLSIDGGAVTRYLADGLILATPTGSTAYSLAAGGPVLMPDSGSFVITPISPHALGVRPLVVRDTCRITLTNRRRRSGDEQAVAVYADGEEVRTLPADGEITVRRARRRAGLVELEGYDPYEVLSRKLRWSGTTLKG